MRAPIVAIGETAAPADEPGGSRGKAIYSRPAKFASLALALALTAGTLLVGAKPGYTSKPHVAAAVGDISEYTVPTTTPGAPYFIAPGPDGNLWFTDNVSDQVAKLTTSGAVIVYRAPTPCRRLGSITAGPDGNLWFTCATGNTVVKVTTSGAFTAYTISTADSSRVGIATGPDGNLWFTESGLNKVAKVTTSGVFTAYSVPTAYSGPGAIAAGPDGNLWFAEVGASSVAKVTTSGVFTEYPIPTANSTPWGIAAGPDGNLWFIEKFGNKVGKVTTSGVFTEYTIPTASSYPNDITAGPDGNLWFTEIGGKVAKVTTSGVFSEYTVPTGSSYPHNITAGPDGNLWTTEAGAVAKVTTSGVITEYPIHTGSSGPDGIAAGPDGNLWFTEGTPSANKVAKVTTSGAFTEYSVPTANLGAGAIAAGTDGNLWFMEGGPSSQKLGKVTTSGTVTEYPVPTDGGSDITVGPDGNLWFTDLFANKVTKVTTSGAFTPYTVPTANGNPWGIAAGPDGNLWFTEERGNKVAKLTTSGVFTEYPLPSANGGPYGIAAGPDGNLWFTEHDANKVAKVTTSGSFTEYPIPTSGSGPWGIAAGPDGNLWFTEEVGNKVAKVTTSGVLSEYTIPTTDSYPYGIAAGPDGNIWFTENQGNKVAMVVASVVPSCPTAGATPATVRASSTSQYTLANSDGATWHEIDAAKLQVTCMPTATQSILLTANADLFTGKAGYNQDIGIFVSDNGAADQLLAWKESGGFAGTFSPNAAYVQGLFNMVTGHTYVFRLKWKTNKPAAGATIYAGAGSGPYSPTSLIAETFPTGVVPDFAVSTKQYTLSNSDGAAWQTIDMNLATSLSPTVDAMAVVGGNADLWTAKAGFNQDLGIFVSDNGGPETLVGWKESGGFAGTYSPNAAFVKATYPMTAGHVYIFGLKWKTNKNAVGTGATIVAAAGGGPVYSQTSLLAETAGTTTAGSTLSTSQYHLSNSDGATWQTIDPALNTGGPITADTNVIVGGNADLWTASPGFNQDIGIFVQVDTGADVLLAWKESGGFAGTYSPNAAFVQTTYLMTAGHTYMFKLKWKTNKNAPGATIYAAAGGGPVYSQTRLTVEFTS